MRDTIKILLLGSLLTGCSPKVVQPETKYIETEKIEYRDRIVTVESPADSANIEALLRCDEKGNVLVTSLQHESSRNASLTFQVDSLNRLIASFSTSPVEIPVEVHDTTYIHDKGEKETVIKEVEKKLSLWQRIQLVCGKITLAAFLLFLGYIIIRVYGADIVKLIKKKLKG